MQSDIETKAYNIYLEQMITANEGFWRDAPLFADHSKVYRIQDNFSDTGGVAGATGWASAADADFLVTAAHNIRGRQP